MLGSLKNNVKMLKYEITKAEDAITSNESLGESHTWGEFVNRTNTQTLELAETMLSEFIEKK